MLAALLGCLGIGVQPSPAPYSTEGEASSGLDNATEMIAEANSISEPQLVEEDFPSII